MLALNKAGELKAKAHKAWETSVYLLFTCFSSDR